LIKRILVVYYSHSGDVARSSQSFVRFLEQSPEVELTWECIKPKVVYPFPWNLYRFFDVFPECINQEPPEIEKPQFSPDDKFDLVILAYQVWFLAPSLPIQGFLQSEYAKVLKQTKVITLIGCRNMWHSASETMKKLIAQAGGIQIDNVVVTHQGSPLITFITTPRLLLTGKKDSLLGVLPPGGFLDEDINSLSRFGQRIVDKLNTLNDSSDESLFQDLNPVEVNKNYVLPELIGQTLYRPWAKLARAFGSQGSWTRLPIIFLFALQLVLAIPVVLLMSAIVNFLFAPLLRQKLDNHIQMLKSTRNLISP